MESKEAPIFENISNSSPSLKNKPPQGSLYGPDQKKRHSHKHHRRCSSPHCTYSKKAKCYSGKNNRDGSLDAAMNGKPRFCGRHGSYPPTILEPFDGMGPLQAPPIVMPSPYVEPARSEGSSTEVRMVHKVIPPKQPSEASHDNKESSNGAAEEFMEVTSQSVVKRCFDLNLLPPEYDEWMCS